MKSYVTDFETTTDPENCYVWAYAICDTENLDNIEIGTNIDDFMKWCRKKDKNDRVYFHNLKFDAQFILNWLFKNGFKHVENSRDKASKTFTTMISDRNLYYSIEVIFYKNKHKVNKVIFQDSLKLIPLSVEEIANTLKLPFKKLKIDYHAHNGIPAGTPLTKEEIDYIKNDVKIVAQAVNYFHSQGLDKMTISACALNEYKALIGERDFKRWFPVPFYHEEIKETYKGGYTYLNPKFEGKIVKNGFVLDLNSSFADAMKNQKLPYGTPIYFKGKYQEDKLYPLYTQMIRCQFELKKGKMPTIQVKYNHNFKANEYLTSSNDEEITLYLNNIDLELFLEHYNVYNLEYVSGWKFKASKGLFDEYIDKWTKIKIKATEEENWGLRLIAKLFLVSLYGKFGSDTKKVSKIPKVSDDGTIYFENGTKEEKDGIYIAMASFITAYARKKLIDAAQKITDDFNSGKSDIEFIYCDTDSLHCKSPNFDLPNLEINPTELGAWKLEGKFNKGKFLRQKCYIEELIIDEKEYIEGLENEESYLFFKEKENFFKRKITVAGMPNSCYQYVNFNNFKIGASYKGKKVSQIVKGGMVLIDEEFTINE